MPLDALHSPTSFAMTAASWKRPEIEAAVEWLIGLLDARDPDADLEPDPEGERGDGLVGDEDDAEDALPLERVRVARRVCAMRRRGEGGFTLLEVLVVIAILGLLIGLVAPAVLRQLGGAKVNVAKQSVSQLSTVLDMYKLDAGSYPTTSEGLSALVSAPPGAGNWNGPYMQGGKLPVDPWGHAFAYRAPSTRPGQEYDLCSSGPDAKGTSEGIVEGPGTICNN